MDFPDHHRAFRQKKEGNGRRIFVVSSSGCRLLILNILRALNRLLTLNILCALNALCGFLRLCCDATEQTYAEE